MKFVITDDAIDRLRIHPEARGIEFDGPTIREGLIGGFDGKTRKWIRARLKIDRLDTLDTVEARIIYYLVAIRSHSPGSEAWLPIERMDDVALADFELSRHVVTMFDQDGDCGECAQPLRAPVHIEPEPGAPAVPPT